ncbi:BON domain-containing protein [Streptomyces neyagawaensis]|uniref:BON domain-containing protein n=1 Tax=Streptomyces neyagawaensis TaxID=42238 RepID=UPI0006E1FD64|nr:BON domain-containing protein [Streptomyces neyagawaensis]MCL6732686.1 BON domain-containing protein [Streptomyces neyagawaensis]
MTDLHGRLVGVVSRQDLLRALIRDDTEIQAEVESLVGQHLVDTRAVDVAVKNGVVTLTGRLEKDLILELLAPVRDIDDVVEVVDAIVAV